MRTTLDVDEDVLLAVKERARRESRSAGKVISELARQALTRTSDPRGDGSQAKAFHGFRPLPHRGRPVTNTVIDELREDDLE